MFAALPWRGAADHVLGLWFRWHAAPAGCRDRVVSTVAFCIGSQEDRLWVLYLELVAVSALIVSAFLLGRFTADIPLTFGLGDAAVRRRTVRIRVRQSRFENDDAFSSSASSRSGHVRHGEASRRRRVA